MMMKYTLQEFNQLLASSEPAPGGGSTAALSGVLGTALTMMVVNLSVGRKSFEALDECTKRGFMEDFEEVKRLNGVLAELAEEDTRAFNAFMEASKLPKGTAEEQRARTDSLQKAAAYALQVPLSVMEKCLTVLKHQLRIARYGNKNAVSDVGVGALLAFAGLEGAALNVRINLPGISDENLKKEAGRSMDSILAEGSRLKQEIMEIVNGRIHALG